MFPTAFIDAITATSTSASYPLGQLRWHQHATYGMTMWRYVKNSEASTAFAQGDVIQCKASDLQWNDGILAATAKLPRHKILGVADHAIAAGSYGWIICQGRCQVECDGSVAANDTIETEGTAGRAKTATLTNADEAAAAFGVALEADGAAGSLADCRINCL